VVKKRCMMMMRLILSICLLAFVVSPSGDRFRNYHAVEAYEIRPGVMISPVYIVGRDVCEISIEKRHYSNNNVDLDAAMSKAQILSLFDELVPQEERGQPGGMIPGNTEITDIDSGMLTTSIPYENVTLAIYGKKDRPDRQKYVAAIISWNKRQCGAK
jgi:hypothetical protein